MTNKGKGYYINSGNELDDIAYTLYLDDKWEQVYTAFNDYWFTMDGFKKSTEKDKYYELANIIIRKKKIDNIKNGWL